MCGIRRYPFLLPSDDTPACEFPLNGEICLFNGIGPSSVLDPRCTGTGGKVYKFEPPLIGNSGTTSVSGVADGSGGVGASTAVAPSAVAISAGQEEFRKTGGVGIRDKDLQGLIKVLHDIPVNEVPDALQTNDQYVSFMAHLIPWIISPPTAPMKVMSRPTPLVVDCADKKYGDVLTGRQLDKPVPIVQFVRFGVVWSLVLWCALYVEVLFVAVPVVVSDCARMACVCMWCF